MSRFTRFAVLAILGSLLGSALLMGCGGGNEETPAANASNTAPK